MPEEQKITIPIEIEIRVGDVQFGGGATGSVSIGGAKPQADTEERFWLDESYETRSGYASDFLGGDPIPMPTLSKSAMKLVSLVEDQEDDPHLLHYHHFSLAMNRKRRMLFFSAYNTTRNEDLMGTWSRKELSGGSDKWILDPRIPVGHQIRTKELYTPSHFDRGHVVKRDDVYWGSSEDEAQYANFDTFHYTNCTPQHPHFNRSSMKGLWGQLEKHVAEQASAEKLRISVFAGPVLRKNDPVLSDIQVPVRYWKVIAARDDDGGALGAWAFLLSQQDLVEEEEESEEEGVFSTGEFAPYQVSLKRIQNITSVRFPEILMQADRHRQEEAGEGPARIDALTDIEV